MEFTETHPSGLDLSHIPVAKTAFEDTLNQLIRLHMAGNSLAITAILNALPLDVLQKLKKQCDTVIQHNAHLVKECRVIQNAVIALMGSAVLGNPG